MMLPATPGLPAPNVNTIMDRLTRRRDFLNAADAPAWKSSSVIIQAKQRGDEAPARIGFTVTKKLGNAVARNRIRRRLREAVRLTAPQRFVDGFDYVLIGRQRAQDRPFAMLREDVDQALEHLNKGQSNHSFPRRSRK